MPWFVSLFTHCTRSLLCVLFQCINLYPSILGIFLFYRSPFIFFVSLIGSLALWVLTFLDQSSAFCPIFHLLPLCFFFFFFGHNHVTCRLLVPWPGIEPVPRAVDVQSLNHWATREVLLFAPFSRNFLWKNFNCTKGSSHVMSPVCSSLSFNNWSVQS